MSFVLDSNDLDYWSGQPSSKADIALIISRLIRATTPGLMGAIIPIGKSTYSGGWDGEVNNSQATEFVPEGLSFWELGTEVSPAAKAQKDYLKRTEQTAPTLREQATLVLVTSRTWNRSGDWVNQKKAEGRWKAIRVIDGKSLVEWLALSPIISQQLATLMGRKINNIIESPQQFWDNWSRGPKNLIISPKLLLAGRQKTADALLERLQQTAAVIPIQASNKEEATAFITAALLTAPNREYYLAQTALINAEEDFKLLMHERPGILIPRFEGGSVNYAAARRGHYVLLPLGADSVLESEDKIVLPKLGRDEVLKALQEMGLSDDQSRNLSRETGRNITIIRRRMGFEGTQPKWANNSAFEELFPALLAGRWQDDKPGDQLIISHIAGRNYGEQITALRKWTISGDHPLTQIGMRWQLTSSLDAWTYLGPLFSQLQLQLLRESFLIACGDIKPFLRLEPEQRPWASFYGKLPDFSRILREGLTQSLVLIALYGENYQLQLPSNPQHWVDGIVTELCAKHEGDLWKSLDDVLPLIAEASPRAFLTSLENFLQQDPDKLQQIFESGGGLISPSYYHTGLLWALEGLAWLPEHLSRCCLALVQLNYLDPGVKIQNKPINSLHHILHPWMPQTSAKLAERIATVRLICSRHPVAGWQLGLSLLPGNSSVAYPTSRPRWRLFSQESPEPITNQEYGVFISFLVNELISLCGTDSSRIAALFDHIRDLSREDLHALIAHVENNLSDLTDVGEQLRDSIRTILHNQHLRYRNNWQVGAEETHRLELLYKHFSPKDISAELYVFNDHWPKFPEGFRDKTENPDVQEKYILRKRLEVMRRLYRAYSFENFLALTRTVGEPGIFGNVAALLPLKQAERLRLAMLCTSADRKEAFSGGCFVSRLYTEKGLPYMIRLYRKFEAGATDDVMLLAYLTSLPSEFAVWQFVETLAESLQQSYWQRCRANFWDKDATHQSYNIERLNRAGRHYDAIEVASYNLAGQSTELITTLLLLLADSPGKNLDGPDPGHISRLIDELSKRPDTDQSLQARIEWYYFSILTRRYPTGRPPILYQELARNPTFFVDILCFWFMPDSEEQTKREQEGIEPELISFRAEKAYQLLDKWDVVPGSSYDETGEIALDEKLLHQWVKDARRIAAERGRLGKADIFIGKVLGKYPELNENWPPPAIASLIDTSEGASLRTNFRVSIMNKRSWSSRSAVAGGERERDLASYFQRLSDNTRLLFPVTADVLHSIAETYLHRAKEEDNDAMANDLEY